MKRQTIAVAGTGYVGLSLAVLLAQNNRVIAVDINAEKVEMINRRVSPIPPYPLNKDKINMLLPGFLPEVTIKPF